MTRNLRSVVLLLLLFAVLLFLVGFRLGKRVERIDKTYVPLPTPTHPPTGRPSPSPIESPIAFNTYLNPECGISFLYPVGLKESKMSSSAAELESGAQRIFVTCDKDAVSKIRKEVLELEEMDKRSFKGRKTSVYKKDASMKTWVVYNTATGKRVAFEATDNFVNLIFKTLEFVK